MSNCSYDAIEKRAREGRVESVAEVMRVAVGACECHLVCFFRKRAQETLAEQGIEVVAAARAMRA